MRRRITVPLSVPLLVALLLPSGCSREPSVVGAFGARPTVVLPDRPPAGAQVAELVEGTGEPVGADDVAVVQYTAYGRGERPAGSTFTRGTPSALAVRKLPVALGRALVCHRVGSRVTAVVPTDGRREGGSGDADGRGNAAAPGFYVVDILGVHRRGASVGSQGGRLAGVRVGGGPDPEVSVPAGAPPGRFAAKVVTRGRGRATRAGQLVVVQYAGLVWGRRRVFDSTWQDGVPRAFKLGDGTMIGAWEAALAGVPVGSRVAMVVPPSHGYGSAGFPAYGIRPSDTLVYVVDVLAAY